MKRGGRKVFVLLINPARENSKEVWTFPKGWTGDHGEESLESTALREVREEGGVNAEITVDLGEIHYFFSFQGENISKTVHYFLMEYSDGNPEDHDLEVQEAKWFTLAEAGAKLSYKSDKEVFARALEHIRNG